MLVLIFVILNFKFSNLIIIIYICLYLYVFHMLGLFLKFIYLIYKIIIKLLYHDL
jgi:hypothetical protein